MLHVCVRRLHARHTAWCLFTLHMWQMQYPEACHAMHIILMALHAAVVCSYASQGTANVDTQMLMARETKSRTAEEISKAKVPDPTIVCTGFDKNRYGIACDRPLVILSYFLRSALLIAPTLYLITAISADSASGVACPSKRLLMGL